MKRFVVRLRPHEPLLLGHSQTVGNYRASGEVIPGRTWRGALAVSLLREGDGRFSALFEGDVQAHFGPLFPALGNQAGPYPPTALICKYERDHGEFDSLIRHYALEVATQEGRTPGEMPDWIDDMACPICGEPTKAPEGFIDGAATRKLSTTHVAINRRRRVAEESQLYTREGVLLERAGANFFAGWVDVPDELADTLTRVMAERALQVGANRSRGMGLAEVLQFEPLSPDPVAERAKAFNKALAGVLSDYAAGTGVAYEEIADAEASRYFTLDLRSEAILMANGLPARDPDLSGIGAEVVARWVRWGEAGGWHRAGGLPRRTQASVTGCYLCRFTGAPDWEGLSALEGAGIGQMREQGFGQVEVCAKIHLDTEWKGRWKA